MLNFLRFLRRSPKSGRHASVGKPELWEMKRRFQIDFLKSVGLQPQHYLMDVGCGSLRGGIPTIDLLEVGHYFGVDVRETVLDEARAELKNAGLEHKSPQLILSRDPSDVQIDQRFDYIWAFSSLFHMTDPIVENCIAMVRRLLKPSGLFYANVAIGQGRDGEWLEFPVVERTMERYESLAAKNGLTVTDVGTLAALGHVTGIKYQDRQPMLRFAPIGA